MAKYSRKTGSNSLAYMGVRSVAYPNFIIMDRAPRETDLLGPIDIDHPIGTHWLDTNVDDLWYLAAKSGDVPDWVRFTEVFDNVLQIDTDSGTAYPVAITGAISVLSGPALSTSGVGNTLSITLSNGTAGQLLIASTTGPSQWASIPSTATITVTTGANTLNLESTVPKAFDTLSGDAGIATAVSGQIDVLGGTNILTSASVDTVNVFLDDPPDIAGTLTLSLLSSAGVLMTNGSGLFGTSAGTDGQILVSGGTGPTWANLTSSDASVVITNGANTINLETASVPGLSTLTADDTNTATPTLGKIDILGDGVSTHTSSGGDTLYVSLDDSPIIAGTLTLSPLSTAGVLGTNGSGVVTSSKGTDGQVLIGGGTAPTWANITAGTNIAITDGSNSIAIDTTAPSPTGSYSFFAYQPSHYLISPGTSYFFGAITVMTEVFDTGTAFYPGDGAGTAAYFEAPVDGIYYFHFGAATHAVYNPPPVPPPVPPTPPPYDPISMIGIEITPTSSHNFTYKEYNLMSYLNTSSMYTSVSVYMPAGNKAQFWFRNDYDEIDYDHYLTGNATDIYSYVAGYLVAAT